MHPRKQKLRTDIPKWVNKYALTFADIVQGALPYTSDKALTHLKDNYLSKYVEPDHSSAEERRLAAIVKWLRVELLNKKTNERLMSSDPFFKGLGFGYQILLDAAKIIERLIGKTPPCDLLQRGSFSSGASTSLTRSVGNLYKKFVVAQDVTSRALPYVYPTWVESRTWASLNSKLFEPRIVAGNVLFTVPKNAVIDRVCAKEPDANMFAQKACGDFIRNRLRKRAHIDLNDQAVNRRLAYQASIDGRNATIDLSSASDTLSISLVFLLLPKSWFELLDALRCDRTLIDGAWHVNSMFSSMGNGFTFELESLVFYALARAVCKRSGTKGRISVYGDDIIIPAAIARSFYRVLFWVGFRPNARKSFISGPFRESCGGHYCRGEDVTPIYLRKPITHLSDLILHLNQVREWIIRVGGDLSWSVDQDNPSPTRTIAVDYWLNLSKLVPTSLKGGYDTASREQLVTQHAPASRLVHVVVPAVSVSTQLQAGLYAERLLDLSRRGSSPQRAFLETNQLVVPTTRWSLRRARDFGPIFGLVKPLFLTEQWWYRV